ncbi:MAG TPA: hypothetical protein VFE23_12415 [Usitatibacter sp.]|jgi:hypothetical protein|nr:hypothetical protein [Usitatibacter sp.]
MKTLTTKDLPLVGGGADEPAISTDIAPNPAPPAAILPDGTATLPVLPAKHVEA